MKKILIWVQNNYGIGHLLMVVEYVRIVSQFDKEARFIVIYGGKKIPNVDLHDIKIIYLQPLFDDIKNRKKLKNIDGKKVSETFVQRENIIKEVCMKFKPEFLITEHFPFGKLNFRNEILNMIKFCKKNFRTITVSLIRDLIGKDGGIEYHDRVKKDIRLFDYFLVGGDKEIFDITKEFPYLPEFRTFYLGYFFSKQIFSIDDEVKNKYKNSILVTMGGGADSEDRLKKIIQVLKTLDKKIIVSTGPNSNLVINDPTIEIHNYLDINIFLKLIDIHITTAGYNSFIQSLTQAKSSIFIGITPEQDRRLKKFKEKWDINYVEKSLDGLRKKLLENNQNMFNKELLFSNQRYNELSKTISRTFPNFVRLDASTKCQLKCPCCSTGTGKNKFGVIGEGFLTFENFRKFVDENSFINIIELSNWGEIFLNPDINDIITYANRRNVMLTANNGVNLNNLDDKTAKLLVYKKFQSLSVSIDGASSETYKKYRIRGDFNKVIENVKKIVNYKKQLKSDYPNMFMQYVIFGHNEHEIISAKKLAKSFDMEFKIKFNWDTKYSPIKNIKKVSKEIGIDLDDRSIIEQTKTHNGKYCEQLVDGPQINWDGKLLGCCVNKWVSFGNVFESGLIECLNSEKYLSFVKKEKINCNECKNEYANT